MLKRNKKFWVSVASAFLLLGYCLTSIQTYTVHGESMSPTLHNNDTVHMWQGWGLKKGQLVAFYAPPSWANHGASGLLIKRVAAVPGDRVVFDHGAFKVNGELLVNTPACASNTFETVVPKNNFLAIGDNRANSIDSLEVFCEGNTAFFVSEALVDGAGYRVW